MSLVHSSPTTTRAELSARLWDEVERCVLLGDLYAGAAPSIQDRALDCGWELSSWAERLEAGECVTSPARAALRQAASVLLELAPLG